MEKKSDLTLVTALFDIGRGEMGTSFSRSFDHYRECFSRLLKLDFNLIIYCEPELNDFVWLHRKEHNTRIINKTKEDLRKIPFYDQIQQIRRRSSWINQAGWIADSTQAKLELYNPLVMSKQFMLNDATLHNPFGTEKFLWLDAGITNTVSIEQYMDHDFEKRISKYLNKMLYICFPYDGTVEVHGFEKTKLNELADINTQFVARGGMFGGPKHIINEMNDIYYQLLDQTLRAGYMGTEESIFTIMAYRHKNKCNIKMIENNGLIYKFFEDLKKEPLSKIDSPLAIYVLTFNLPQQLELWVENFKKAFPKEFTTLKKYVINNSNDATVKERYDILFRENNLEVIHEGDNIGINDGRALAAKHFDDSDHEFMIFFEDDMMLCDESFKNNPCKNGFIRWVPQLLDKSIEILTNNNLDYLKLSHSEFFGDCHKNWAYENVPQHKKDEFFPQREDGIDRSKTRISYSGAHRGVSFAVGEYHFDNWPLLFNRIGNRKIFLDVVYQHMYEQTLMSHSMNLQRENKIRAGVLLASPINHDRRYFYGAEKRRENRHYTN